ncbi:hypothetical protein [Thiolapillus sp.]
MNRFTIFMLAVFLCLGSTVTLASDAVTKTVGAVYEEKAQLAGKQVRVSGEIVKVNNKIMGRNFLHLRDGTGKQGSNDLTVTSQETAEVGDQVEIVGTVSTDVDFGSGYTYPLLIEKATITKTK